VRFAREGLIFIGIAAVLALLAVLAAVQRGSTVLAVLALAVVLLALWVAYFFRDPERSGERGEHLVVSPADGRVVMISEVDEPSFLNARAIRISIFMNVFNVHVNRYPVSGSVRHLHYNKGKFINAAHEKASLENEQMSVGLESGSYRILVRQIAGLVARRIANYAVMDASVKQGDRMGIIRFGSRVDVFLPLGSTVRVKLGDLPVAGVTVLGELPS
jgi:phosphatidylserine decarboxylase